MINYIIYFFGLFLIWYAVEYKRSGDSKVNMFTKDWFIQLTLVTIGVVLIMNYTK